MFFPILITLSLICLTTYFIKKRKFNQIQKEMYSKLLTISPELTKIISDFKKKPTIISFDFQKLKKENPTFQKLKCSWNLEEYNIKDGTSISFQIFDLPEENYVTSLKISLINEKYKKDFLINVYSHQNNIYIIYIDDENNPNIDKFSLECIYYSKLEKLLPKNIQWETNEFKKNIKLDEDFGINNRKRFTIININCITCVKIINYCSGLNIDCFNSIFDNRNNNNILLNIRILNKKKKEACLFLNQYEKQIYQLNEKEKEILIAFKKDIIDKFIIPNINKNINSLHSTQNDFFDSILTFAKIHKIDENQKLIYDESKKEFSQQLNLEFKQIELMLNKYFNVPLSERFNKIKINKNDYELSIQIIYIYICIFNNSNIFRSLLKFEKSRLKIEKQFFNDNNNDFNIKDKIRIMFTLRDFIMKNYNENTPYELVKLRDLPYYSPYFSAKLFYRKIIENLKVDSKLTLIFLQLNSGSSLDYNNGKYIYKISMIPLCLIQEHILTNNDNYFFRYFFKDGNYAYTDSYTGIYSFNEFELFQVEKPISTDEDENKVIKINFVSFHEGGHKKFNGNNNMELSQQYFFDNNLNIVDNLNNNEEIGEWGESGNAVDYYMCNKNKEKIIRILKLEIGLKELINVNLYVSESLNELNKIINKILHSAKISDGVRYFNKKKYLAINKNYKDIYKNQKKSRKYYDYGIYSLS